MLYKMILIPLFKYGKTIRIEFFDSWLFFDSNAHIFCKVNEIRNEFTYQECIKRTSFHMCTYKNVEDNYHNPNRSSLLFDFYLVYFHEEKIIGDMLSYFLKHNDQPKYVSIRVDDIGATTTVATSSLSITQPKSE